MTTPGKTQGDEGLARQALSAPDKFPEEFKLWLARFVKAHAPSGGGEANEVLGVVAEWTGPLPTAVGYSLEHMVPYDQDGNSLDFTLSDMYAYLNATYASGTTFVIEKSPSGDAAFVPTTVGTITVAASHYYNTGTCSSSVSSGDRLRINFTALGAAANYIVQIIGAKS